MYGFQRQCGPLRPQFVYLDGFDAHFSNVLAEMEADQIYTFFLRSNNSINDQANDNGINAMFEAAFNRALGGLRRRKPGAPITPPDCNKGLMEAWAYCKTHGGPTIVKAFRVCGVCPVNRNAKNHMLNKKVSDIFRPVDTKEQAEGKPTKVTMKRPYTIFKEAHTVIR